MPLPLPPSDPPVAAPGLADAHLDAVVDAAPMVLSPSISTAGVTVSKGSVLARFGLEPGEAARRLAGVIGDAPPTRWRARAPTRRLRQALARG